MSFYAAPKIDLNIKGSQSEGFTLLLPCYCYSEEFYKLGIRYLSSSHYEKYAQAKLPKNWSYILNETKEGKIVSLFNEEAVLKAKITYGLFVDVDFQST